MMTRTQIDMHRRQVADVLRPWLQLDSACQALYPATRDGLPDYRPEMPETVMDLVSVAKAWFKKNPDLVKGSKG